MKRGKCYNILLDKKKAYLGYVPLYTDEKKSPSVKSVTRMYEKLASRDDKRVSFGLEGNQSLSFRSHD